MTVATAETVTSRVRLGDLLIHDGPTNTVILEGCTVCVLGSNFDLGAPQPVTLTIESMIQDGSLTVIDHYDNRTITFYVGFKASDGVSLARAEETFWLECQKRGVELVYVPSSENAKACCFPIRTAHPTRTQAPSGLDPDLDELMNGARWYQVSLVCDPFVYAAESVTVTAGIIGAAPAPVTTVISDGTSAAGWSDGGFGTAPTSDGGNLVLDVSMAANAYNSASREFAMAHTLAGYDLTATRYVTIDVASTGRVAAIPPGGSSTFGPWNTWSVAPDVWVNSQATPVPKVSAYSLASGMTRYTYDLARFVGTTGNLILHFKTGITSGDSNAYALEVMTKVDNVALTNTVPAPQGGEQVLALPISGSARTPGEIVLQHPTQGLGKVVLHSSPSLAEGYQPGLLQYATTLGAAVAKAGVGTFSGGTSWFPWANTVFTVPVAALPPGPYLLVGHLLNNGAAAVSASLSWKAQAKIGAALIGPIDSDASPLTTIAAGADGLYPLGGMVLDPLGAGENTGASVVITLDATAGLLFDELLLCHVPNGSFGPLLIDCGSGVPALGTVHNVLKIKNADADSLVPQILVGTSAVDSQMISAASWAQSWEQPQLTPGMLDVLVATTGAQRPYMQATYRPAGHTHSAL